MLLSFWKINIHQEVIVGVFCSHVLDFTAAKVPAGTVGSSECVSNVRMRLIFERHICLNFTKFQNIPYM